jgi:hypothetical protein
MSERVLCPVCGREGVEKTCPNCSFPLGKWSGYVLGDSGLPREFEDDVKKHRAVWEERKTKEGLSPDSCFLGLTSSEDADIFVDGQHAGRTQDRYIYFTLAPGKHRIELRTRYRHAELDVELKAGDVAHREVELKRGKGNLRILSEVGKVEGLVHSIVPAGGAFSFEGPCRLEGVEAGQKAIHFRVGNVVSCAVVDVLPGGTTDVRVTRELLDNPKQLRLLDMLLAG